MLSLTTHITRPDVIMLEADQLTGFGIQTALVDLSKYGANDVKKNFSAGV